MDAPTEVAPRFRTLLPGDRMPNIKCRTVRHPGFWCDSLAGRYVVFALIVTASDPLGMAAVETLVRLETKLNDDFASGFAVTIDPSDEARLADREVRPGVRIMFDSDKRVSRACGAVPLEAPPGPQLARRFWLVVDPTLHVIAKLPFDVDDPRHERLEALLADLPPPSEYGGIEQPAPVVMLPNVFEPEFCRSLIDLYETHGGRESGVVRDNRNILDPSFKRRRDHILQDQAVIDAAIGRINRRVVPELERLFFMKLTRIERHIVACYDAADGAHFRPHRDNDFELTMHRRFAVSINLNDGFDGGGVYFPEYSRREHKAPAGWCLIFPCAAMHAVTKVRSGRRYAYLPFLYDEAGRVIRDEMRARADAQGAPTPEAAA